MLSRVTKKGLIWSTFGLALTSLIHLRFKMRKNVWYNTIKLPQKIFFGSFLPVGGYVTGSTLIMIRCGQRKSFLKAYENELDEDLSTLMNEKDIKK